MQAPLVEYETQRVALREDFPTEADDETTASTYGPHSRSRPPIVGRPRTGTRKAAAAGSRPVTGTSHEETRTPVGGVNRSGPFVAIRISRSRKDRTQNQSATASIPA